jgi:hypothetical protein
MRGACGMPPRRSRGDVEKWLAEKRLIAFVMS